MEITIILGLLYIVISLSSIAIMLYRLNSKYIEYPSAVCTAIGLVLTIIFLSNFNWLGFIWLVNTILMAHNSYSIYNQNKE